MFLHQKADEHRQVGYEAGDTDDDLGLTVTYRNIGRRDSSISDDRWRLSLLLSVSLQCLVDLRQISYAKSFVVFLLTDDDQEGHNGRVKRRPTRTGGREF